MNLAPLALGLALATSLSAAAPVAVTAKLNRSGGLNRIIVAASEPGWTFRGDAEKSIRILSHQDGSASVLFFNQSLAGSAVTFVMEKDGEVRHIQVNTRIRA